MSRRHGLFMSLALVAMALGLGLALAKTGSYTIDVGPNHDPNSKIRVTAKSEDGTTYDEEFTVGGQNSEQARNTIVDDLENAGWVVEKNGTNGIIVRGHVSSDPNSSLNGIKEVDMGDNDPNINAKADGNCTVAEALPGDKNFKFAFFAPNAHGTTPGQLLCNINAITVTPALAANDTPAQVAQKLQSSLIAAGLVTSLSGTVVTLDMANPTNAAVLGSSVHVDLGVLNGAGPHVQIGLPPTIPATGSGATRMPALQPWTEALLLLLLLLATLAIWSRTKGGRRDAS
jgi:hypothetical protein